MNTGLRTYTIASIAVLILTVGVRSVPAEPPTVEYLPGEPHQKNVPKYVRKFANVITVFDTVPQALARNRNMDRFLRSVTRKSLGQFQIPEELYDQLGTGPGLLQHTIVQDPADEAPRDRWTIVGVDDAMVKVLCRNLLATLSVEWGKGVAKAEQELAEDREHLRSYSADARETRRKHDEAFRAADERGVAALDRDAVKAASLELRNSLSATLADVAELQARLKTAIDHDRAHRAALTKAGQDANKSPLIRKLAEMQTELEIDLAGKLARRKALKQELTRLAEGNRYLVAMLNSDPIALEGRARLIENRVENDEKELAELESAGPVRVVGGKVVISPIVEPGSEAAAEPGP